MEQELKINQVLADEFSDPVRIKEEDFDRVRELQILTDNLLKLRQEMGRIYQVLGNLRDKANETEVSAANMRRDLVSKYNLDKTPGQWAVDFEQKLFIKVDNSAPVIP